MKEKAGSIHVKGFKAVKEPSKTEKKKIKSAENYAKKVSHARETGKPLKGFKNPPKMIKIK